MRFYYFYTLVKIEFIKLFKIEIKQHNTVIHLQSDLEICFVFGFFTTIRETLGFLACTPVFVSELPAIYLM